jgi:Uma2 family endonuclease
MATVLDTALLTAEEFLHLDDGGANTELVRGRVVEFTLPYTAHGYYCCRIATILGEFVNNHPLGRIGGGGAGVVTERNPDTVRGPDVAFYSYERIPRGPLPEGYWPAAPELVVEIRSHDDRWKDILRKVGEYVSAGVLTVAIADPQTQRIHLFSADREATVLNANEELTFPDILPGFAVPVKRLFE